MLRVGEVTGRNNLLDACVTLELVGIETAWIGWAWMTTEMYISVPFGWNGRLLRYHMEQQLHGPTWRGALGVLDHEFCLARLDKFDETLQAPWPLFQCTPVQGCLL